jgi:predicted dehydrogenase
MRSIEIVACADRDEARASEMASEYGIRAVALDEMLLSDIDIVLNLTTPDAHFAVAEMALRSGKHVYNEKPLCVSLEDGQKLMMLAKDRGLRVGCAPDTFLGAGYQTARNLLEQGAVGQVTGFAAFMLCPGHEGWHPNPFFYYDFGGGPMFDMGPYYLTALVHLFGPIRSVMGMTATPRTRRVVGSQPHAGAEIEVKVPTHVQCLLQMELGMMGTLVTSFDVPANSMPFLQVFGTEATLDCPDPNTFGGPIRRGVGQVWEEMPLEFANAGNSRSLGLADMADAIETGRDHRASGAMALHVLEVMHAVHRSFEEGREIQVGTCEQPAMMQIGLGEGEVG